ncbi:MAG: hypothetical protein ABI472_16090 [Ginsengibacter sp.]
MKTIRWAGVYPALSIPYDAADKRVYQQVCREANALSREERRLLLAGAMEKLILESKKNSIVISVSNHGGK